MNRICPYEYNEAKRNWEYGKPNWCPLREIEPAGSVTCGDVGGDIDASGSVRCTRK